MRMPLYTGSRNEGSRYEGESKRMRKLAASPFQFRLRRVSPHPNPLPEGEGTVTRLPSMPIPVTLNGNG